MAEERPRSKKRAKGKGDQRGEVKTKSEEEEEDDAEARRSNWIRHKRQRYCLRVCVTSSYCFSNFHDGGQSLYFRRITSLPPVQKKFRQPEPIKKVQRSSKVNKKLKFDFVHQGLAK